MQEAEQSTARSVPRPCSGDPRPTGSRWPHRPSACQNPLKNSLPFCIVQAQKHPECRSQLYEALLQLLELLLQAARLWSARGSSATQGQPRAPTLRGTTRTPSGDPGRTHGQKYADTQGMHAAAFPPWGPGPSSSPALGRWSPSGRALQAADTKPGSCPKEPRLSAHLSPPHSRCLTNVCWLNTHSRRPNQGGGRWWPPF